MISGVNFYRAYLAIKLHFTTSYDVIKYKGKTKVSENDFYLRNDHLVFEKWAKRVKNQDEAIELSISNFMGNTSTWAHDDFETPISIYKQWKSTQSALTFKITEDFRLISTFIENNKSTYDNFLQKTEKGNKPPLLQLFLTKRVLPDTVISLDSLHTAFIDRWLSEYQNDPLVKRELFKLSKYRPFIRPDYYKLVPNFNEIIGDSRGKN